MSTSTESTSFLQESTITHHQSAKAVSNNAGVDNFGLGLLLQSRCFAPINASHEHPNAQPLRLATGFGGLLKWNQEVEYEYVLHMDIGWYRYM